jgi:hypothetical protein
MNDNDSTHADLVNDVVFGKRIEMFLSSDVGQYILQRILNETDENTSKLIVVDPGNFHEVQRLQNKILVTQSIKNWLEDALSQALEADARLTELE